WMSPSVKVHPGASPRRVGNPRESPALDRLTEMHDRVHSCAVRHFALTSHSVFRLFPSVHGGVIVCSSMTSLTIPLCSTADRHRYRETDCGKNQAGRLGSAGGSQWVFN